MEKNIDWEIRTESKSLGTLGAVIVSCGCLLPAAVICTLALFTDHMDILILTVVFSVVILLAATVVFSSARSVVNANKNNVTVKDILCGQAVSVKKYEYSDIESAECRVFQFSARNSSYSVCYGMWVKIKLKNGKTLKYDKALDISSNLHKYDLKKYNHLVESEDMFKLCAFINDIKAKQKG